MENFEVYQEEGACGGLQVYAETERNANGVGNRAGGRGQNPARSEHAHVNRMESITAFATDLIEHLEAGELTESKAFIKSFAKNRSESLEGDDPLHNLHTGGIVQRGNDMVTNYS